MSYGVQPQAKKPSSVPKILTIICSVLAVIFLLVSTTMFVSARSKAQEIEEGRAEIQSADAQTVELNSEITSVKEQIAAAKEKKEAQKEAQKWCDDVTRENATETKLRSQGSALKSMNQPTRDAVDNLCSQKKAFIEAFAQDAKANTEMITPSSLDCQKDGKTMTITATVTITAPSLLAYGSMDVTYNVFAADHAITKSDTPLGTATATVPSSGSGPLSTTMPISGNETHCSIEPVSIWPTGL